MCAFRVDIFENIQFAFFLLCDSILLTAMMNLGIFFVHINVSVDKFIRSNASFQQMNAFTQKTFETFCIQNFLCARIYVRSYRYSDRFSFVYGQYCTARRTHTDTDTTRTERNAARTADLKQIVVVGSSSMQ